MTTNDLCQKFLEKHHLNAAQYSVTEILAAFMSEMENGLAGKESSLAMIPSYIPLPKRVPKNEKIMVLDAGGTNFRTALVRFDESSRAHIDYFINNPMPGIAKELSKEAFFDYVADYLEPVLTDSKRLGFCFSYPTQIDPSRDGTLLYWTKEVKAPQVVGEKILANTCATLKKRGCRLPDHMLLLNDTVSSLLAGLTTTRFSTDYNYIGFILGTGTNTAYIEKNGNITKLSGLQADGCMAINCESANFSKINRGDIDIAFDETTSSPNKYILEKMVSGGYLGGLCYQVLLTAGKEKVISKSALQMLQTLGSFNAPFLSTILSGSLSKEPLFTEITPEDLEKIQRIISEVVERAALLTAINMAGAVVHCAKGDEKKKFCIAADGSLYYKLHSFRERIEKYLAEILQPYGVEYKIVHVKEAPIIGTAVAGLV